MRAPDAAFVSRERLPAVRRGRGFGEGASDLAGEVVSPDDRAADTERKAVEYLAAGARSVCILFPRTGSMTLRRAHGAALHLWADDAVLEDDPALPRFRSRLGDLFDGPAEERE